MQKLNVRPEWVLILCLALMKLLLHFLTNTNYELHRDAFLYLSLADHPDWGYFSVPPAIAALANITQFLFGDSVFSIRLFPALMGAASVVFIGLIVKELGGKTWAILLACSAFILSPAFLRSNTLFQPVSFDQFFWLLTGYFMVKLLKHNDPKYWIHLGVTWGAAFLTKYAIVFMAFAALLALLCTPQRSLFRSKYFLIGMLAGFLIILPNLLWQYQHNWPVIHHLAELQRTQLVNVNIADFILLQFLMNLHAVFIWLFGLIFLIFFRQGKPFRVLGFTFLIMLLTLIILRGKHYYTLGMYSVLFAAGGVAMELYFTGRRRFLKPVILTVMVLIAAPVIPYSLPVLPHDKMAVYAEQSKSFGLEGALRWEDGRIHTLPQDYADMTGWAEIAQIVINTYNGLSAEEKSRCAIYCENYGQAGAVKYHGKKYGLPEPVSFSDNYLLWAPDSVKADILIYVNDELGEDISEYFAEIKLAGQLTNEYAREYGLQVYLCQQPRGDFSAYYQAKVTRVKNYFELQRGCNN
jgi:hypothetical protein